MPLSPEAYAARYSNLMVPEIALDESGQAVRGGLSFIAIRRYLNESLGHAQHMFGAAMLRDLAALAAEGRHGVSGSQASFTLGDVSPPLVAVNIHGAIYGFMGKATPAEMILSLRLASFWIALSEHRRQQFPTLQDFADANLGMDCNGFAGTYFTSQFPGTQYSREKPPREYDHVTNRRANPREVAPLDVVLPAGGNYHHISVISRILSRDDHHVEVRLSESQHPVFHGVTTTTARIRYSEAAGFIASEPVYICRPLRIPENAVLSEI